MDHVSAFRPQPVLQSPPLAGSASARFHAFSEQALVAASARIDGVARSAAAARSGGAASQPGHAASPAAAAGAAALAAALATPEGQVRVHDFLAQAGRFLREAFTLAKAEI